MKILMISPEMTPFASVGGLGDVVGALPKELAKKGHDVRVVMPLYGFLEPQCGKWKALETPMEVSLGWGRKEHCRVWENFIQEQGVRVYFLEYNKYFHRHEIYTGPWGSHTDNNERFSFLSRAGIDICYFLDWIPDVIHCHDWTTGFVPVYLNTTDRDTPLGNTASVFTIHNLEHQGIFGKEILDFAGIPFSEFRPDSLESVGCVNMLKGALYHATKVTTVSPNYANEIRTSQGGCGLDKVLQFRGADLIGVLNGIDSEYWNPATNKQIPANYSFKNFDGKICKQKLQERFGLKQDEKIPIFGVIGRMYQQKAFDLLATIVPRLMAEMHIQIAVLGAGESWLEKAFSDLAGQYPGKIGAYIGYNKELSLLIESGSDFFVMPSRFEPCGLVQMEGMRYGAVAVARATGGLADTIEDFSPETKKGTGFLFEEYDPSSFLVAIIRAWVNWRHREAWKQIQKRAMEKDFSWLHSAKEYEKLFKLALKFRAKA